MRNFDNFDNMRIEAAVRIGGQEFWKNLAEIFEEVKSGDMCPLQVRELKIALETAAHQWLANNRDE
jgi:hypothetical protein